MIEEEEEEKQVRSLVRQVVTTRKKGWRGREGQPTSRSSLPPPAGWSEWVSGHSRVTFTHKASGTTSGRTSGRTSGDTSGDTTAPEDTPFTREAVRLAGWHVLARL